MQPTNLPITITRKKIKNMYLRVHQDGTVSVSAPKRCSDKVIWDFINSKSDWIMAQRDKMLARQPVEQIEAKEAKFLTGEIHYLWGKPCTLIVKEMAGRGSVEFVKNPQFEEQNHADNSGFGILYLHAPANSTVEQRKHLLEEFYRRELKAVVPHLLEKYAAIVGKSPTEWRIRNMKTRWGTCNTKDKRIWLALNLAKKPPECLEYVITHELTHLHVPNHSKAFWARMDVYYPAWREVRKLLNK